MAAIFQPVEINTMIHLLRMRYGRQLFGKCSDLFVPGVNEAKLLNLRYLPKNTASLTDVILAQAQIGTNELFNVALKIWFDWSKIDDTRIGMQMIEMCKAGGPDCTGDKLIRMLKTLGVYRSGSLPMPQYQRMLAKFQYDPTTTSLNYEARVYSYITENIIMRNICPGFIPLLSFSSCMVSEIDDVISDHGIPIAGGDKLKEKLRELSTYFPELTMKFMITGSATNVKPLIKFVNDGGVTSVLIATSIIFQAFYALYVMGKYKIRHSDLHNENMFVQTLLDPVILTFHINQFTISFATTHIVKIYDFDRAYIEALGNNDRLDDFGYIGCGNFFRQDADLNQFVCELSKMSVTCPQLGIVLASIGLDEAAGFIIPAGSDENDGTCHSVAISAETFARIRAWMATPEGMAETRLDRKTNYYYVTFGDAESTTLFTLPELDLIKLILNRNAPAYSTIVTRIIGRFNHFVTAMEICEGWQCLPFHDLVFSCYEFFETQAGFDLFKALMTKEAFAEGMQEMVYTYIAPTCNSFATPPVDASELYEPRDVYSL